MEASPSAHVFSSEGKPGGWDGRGGMRALLTERIPHRACGPTRSANGENVPRTRSPASSGGRNRFGPGKGGGRSGGSGIADRDDVPDTAAQFLSSRTSPEVCLAWSAGRGETVRIGSRRCRPTHGWRCHDGPEGDTNRRRPTGLLLREPERVSRENGDGAQGARMGGGSDGDAWRSGVGFPRHCRQTTGDGEAGDDKPLFPAPWFIRAILGAASL